MSETLININQNQLNTETGSFVELIKSTQQGKEAITNALVNKGINATSDQTLTSMAGAIDSLIVSDLQVWKGNIATKPNNISSTSSGMPFCKVIENEWGRWGFYWNDYSIDGISSITIYNISDYVLASITTYTGFASKSVSINTAFYNYDAYDNISNKYPFSPLFYFNEDGTQLYYVGDNDGAKNVIYVYTISYSDSSASIPIDNVSISLSRTLQLSSGLPYPHNPSYGGGSWGAGVYYVDTENKTIVFGAYSASYNDGSRRNTLKSFNSDPGSLGSTNTSVNQVYKVVYNNDSGDESGLTATAFTNLNTMPQQGVTTPFFISSDKCIVCNNSSIYLIAVDIANATFKWYGQSAETYTGNAYHSLTFQNNKFIASIKDEIVNNRNIKETLTLISDLPNDDLSGSIQEFSLGIYTKPIFITGNNTTNVTLASQSLVCAKIINKNNLIGGLIRGSFWKLSFKDDKITAKPMSTLINITFSAGSIDMSNSGYIIGESLYVESDNFWVEISNSNISKLETFLEDQFVGLSYKGQNGTEVYYSPQIYYTDGTLTMESPEVLVEDN